MVKEPAARALRSLIRRFDSFQRRRLGVTEFCDATECVLRVRATGAPHALELGDISVATSEPVIELHLWNEHLPRVPADGPDLGWALGMQRRFVGSLRLLARHMEANPASAGARAVGGALVLISPGGHPGGVRLMERLGFTVEPYHRPLGRFGEFWENFYSWWIIWTYNPGSLRGRRLTGLERTEIWMPADEFLRRYGSKPATQESLGHIQSRLRALESLMIDMQGGDRPCLHQQKLRSTRQAAN